jgi:hypothetical protein
VFDLMTTRSSNGGLDPGNAFWSRLFSFPHPVNEVAARMVAGMVLILGLAIILLDQAWLMGFLAYGFLARVLTGPTLSPMGLLATRVLVPVLGNHVRPVAGPPKRFAQALGLAFSATALTVHFGLGLEAAAEGVLAVMLIFAAAEAILGFCAGCFVFGYLMRWGLVPKEVCEQCQNLTFLPLAVAENQVIGGS